MAKKKQSWSVRDVFLVPQRDDRCSLGQALDLMMANVVTCAFSDVRLPKGEIPDRIELSADRVISTASVTREQLDYWEWKVVGPFELVLPRERWANEPCRSARWVGAKIHDAAILEDFLNAYHGLEPWDAFADPSYFDKLLISPERKPAHLVYRHRKQS